ncbi:lymphotoxin-alpha-like [Anarrhichthys ocellatus]|uniref:lymphotoxin-alpha-like n=1 Tax=Anarrhichthys ocellatus TaxID=433405 RepID=UPI0012ECFC09|nr:lymphotoxin-alpha-like [Anarrhichthys ocellatus]
MEEEGCYSCGCSGGEAGLHRQDMLIELLRQKETRHQRMAHLLAVTLLLLLSGALALLVPLVFGARGQQAPDSQPMLQPHMHSSGVSLKQEQQKDFKNPCAMLTAPRGNYGIGTYLEWESEVGLAFCHGGFNYSSGDLLVPRTGIYRVFLQITYESKDDPNKCVDEPRLSNSVFFIRDAYNDNVVLLSSVDTLNCSIEQWSKTLYTAGLFSLEANGRLHVKSSHPGLIVKSQHKVFFGAELLPQ